MNEAAPDSTVMISRGIALTIAAAVMLVPANVLPVLATEIAGETALELTIMSGVVRLWQDGLWPLGVIVFVASIAVPLLKLAGMARLLRAVRRGPGKDAAKLTRLYLLLDFIGRWSMLDVFLAGFLAGAVRFESLATVEPRSGIVAFAMVVVLTLLATRSFDPRLLWPAPAIAGPAVPRP
jgi:paraquat-inducible protein A